MKIVLMAGGKGTRLWPLSTNTLPKQFLTLSNMQESMLTSTYNKASKLNEMIYVATQNEYCDIVKQQIDENIKIICEPCSHNTFAAFLNIAVYLKYIEKTADNEIVALLPTDHEVQDDFYNILKEAEKVLINGKQSFCLVGVKPQFPSTQYGYIIHNNSYVERFIEKPEEKKAVELINKGAVWNSGILIFRLKEMLEISKKYCTYNSYQVFLNNYTNLPKNSFDYEVLEKQENTMIVLSDKKWKDLGSWKSLYEKISKPDEYNSNIINNENKEIKNFGIRDSIIVNGKEGLALYPKESNFEKNFKTWGYYEILNSFVLSNMHIKIKHLKIIKNKNISYQKHNFRDEIWILINGSGEVIINGKLKQIKKGDTLCINKRDKHSIKAKEDIDIIEIQQGSKTTEEDIERITYEWENIPII